MNGLWSSDGASATWGVLSGSGAKCTVTSYLGPRVTLPPWVSEGTTKGPKNKLLIARAARKSTEYSQSAFAAALKLFHTQLHK